MPKIRVVSKLEAFQGIDDLDNMWRVFQPELTRRLGRSQFICLPHITDGNCYGIGGLIVKTHESGFLCTKKKTFQPLGPMENFINKESTKDYWHSKHPLLYSRTRNLGFLAWFKSLRGDSFMDDAQSRAGFTIALEDSMGHKEIKLNVESINSRSLPPDISPIGTVVFDRTKHPELKQTDTVYIVTNVKEVDRLELHGSIGSRARVYHIIKRYPLYFTYQKFKINQEGKVIAKAKCKPTNVRTTWLRKNLTDNLDDVPRPDWNIVKQKE